MSSGRERRLFGLVPARPPSFRRIRPGLAAPVPVFPGPSSPGLFWPAPAFSALLPSFSPLLISCPGRFSGPDLKIAAAGLSGPFDLFDPSGLCSAGSAGLSDLAGFCRPSGLSDPSDPCFASDAAVVAV